MSFSFGGFDEDEDDELMMPVPSSFYNRPVSVQPLFDEHAEPKEPDSVAEFVRMRGRPTVYQDSYCKLARNYCLLGATNESLAALFEVGLSTIKRWLVEHPEFRAAVMEGREAGDANVASSLYRRACGYEIEEVKLFAHKGHVTAVKTLKHYPADPGAALNWLKNRRPNDWRDKKEIEIEGDGTLNVVIVPSKAAVLDEAQPMTIIEGSSGADDAVIATQEAGDPATFTVYEDTDDDDDT